MHGDDFESLSPQEARVFKAGNSLAIRIPSALAKRVAIEDGAHVQLAADSETIYVRKAPSRELAELIARITPENLHEPLLDELVGVERW
jgi:antitoxin MazE